MFYILMLVIWWAVGYFIIKRNGVAYCIALSYRNLWYIYPLWALASLLWPLTFVWLIWVAVTYKFGK